jgi:hypothetical protein
MSDAWFNLRIFLWHFKIAYGRLFRVKVSYNGWWWCRQLLWKPVWLHTFEPRRGWQRRNDPPCEPVGQQGAP